MLGSEAFFKIIIIIFIDTLILQIYFLIIKLNIFRGDLSSISAKTATLVLGVQEPFVVLKLHRGLALLNLPVPPGTQRLLLSN